MTRIYAECEEYERTARFSSVDFVNLDDELENNRARTSAIVTKRMIKQPGYLILLTLMSFLGLSIDVSASESPRWLTRLQSRKCIDLFQPLEFVEDGLHVKADNETLRIHRGEFGITADRFDGRISFTITAKFREKRDEDLRGYLLFDAMMLVLGRDRPPILGNWQNATNLELFNETLAAGGSDEDAAWSTWTGQQARRYGYHHLEIEKIVRRVDSGTRATRVEVVFYNNESRSDL